MSLFLLRDPDCVLIHIPKTGGSTIRKGIWDKNYEGPAYGRIPEHWLPNFKFAFVRHPLDRLVSAWADFKQLRNYKGSLDQFIDIVLNDDIIFDENRQTTAERIRHHVMPQTHPFFCLDQADFVGRFETYEEDLNKILNKVGMPAADVGHHRKTQHSGWREILPDSTVDRLVRFYADDFSVLSYERP
tara:strand:+ start:586 stop:1146 length:561 start_codon:yes stop_codon:yes gene_type:complete